MSEEYFVYVGTYTRGRNEGIYVYRFNPSSCSLEPLSETGGIVNPSFLAIDPKGRHLYAVNEIHDYEGKRSGAVAAFSINPETGELTFLNRKPSKGPGPCYVSISENGRFVFAANYGGGSICMLPVEKDGKLGDPTDFVQHHGSSVNPNRQEGPHAHCIVPDPSDKYVFVADLGLDKVMIYEIDRAEGKLRPHDPPWVQTKPGAGPRHLTFHPNGRYAYLINELDSTLIAFTYDEERGVLKELQTISTLPEDFSGENTGADVHVDPSGRFVYGSNRGHDSIVIYRINEDTGKLTLVGHEPTQGRIPRNFAIDPTGTCLLAANQNSDNIVFFKINRETGKLNPTGQVVKAPKPVCIKFVKAP